MLLGRYVERNEGQVFRIPLAKALCSEGHYQPEPTKNHCEPDPLEDVVGVVIGTRAGPYHKPRMTGVNTTGISVHVYVESVKPFFVGPKSMVISVVSVEVFDYPSGPRNREVGLNG